MSDLKKTVEIIFEGKDKLSSGLTTMRQGFSRFASGVGAVLKPLAMFGAAMGAATAAGAYLVKQELIKADALAKTADTIGISTDALQEWGFVAERSGVASSSLEKGLFAFTKRLGEAKVGTGALVTYLKKYDEELLNTLTSTTDTGDALNIFMHYLAGISDESEKAALAAAAFSRTAGLNMTIMTRGGTEALTEMQDAFKDLGITIDEELLRNSELAVDAFADLEKTFDYLKMFIGASLAPEFEALAEFLVSNRDGAKDMADAFVDFIKTDIAGYFKEIDWGDISDGVSTAVDLLNDMAVAAAGAVEASGYIFGGQWARDIADGMDAIGDPMGAGGALEWLFGGGMGEDIESLVSWFRNLGEEGETALHRIPWEKAQDDIKDTTGVAVDWGQELAGQFDDLNEKVEDTGQTFEDTGIQMITMADGTVKYYQDVGGAIDEVGEKVKEAIPTEKMMEIKLQGEIDKELAQIKADADIIQTAVEWQAQLDIANVEAETERIKSAFESINNTFSATTDALTGLFGIMAGGGLDIAQKSDLKDAIEQQLEMQREALDMQKKLVDAQTKLLELRAKALDSGEPLIKITGEGLKPHIEAFMWEIIEETQVRITEEGLDTLLSA